MMNYQRDLMQKQQGQQEMLAPLLYKQAGIEPVYAPSATSQDTGMEFQNGKWVQVRPNTVGQEGPQQIIGYRELPAAPKTPEELAYQQLLELQVKGARSAEAMVPIQLRQQGYEMKYDENGTPVGMEIIPGGQADLQQKAQAAQLEAERGNTEINKIFQERTKKALAGELPLDPGIKRQLDENEQSLRATLAKNLGPGYETSTPGIQALANFNKRREETISAFQHGEIASSAELGMRGQTTERGTNPFSTVTAASEQGQFLNPFAQAGSPQARTAQLMNAVSAPFGKGGSDGSTLAGQFGQTASALAGQRAEQAKLMAQERAAASAKWGTIGTGIGTVVGGAAGAMIGGVGAAPGAMMGGALGGTAGTYFGS